MATVAAAERGELTGAVSGWYERFAGLCGILTGVVGLLYAVAFVILHSPALSAVSLLLGGLLGTATLVAVYARLRETDSSFASGLGFLGYVTAVLLIVVYLARLIVLDASSPLVLAPAALAGFLASPVWYVWLGLSLWRNTP